MGNAVSREVLKKVPIDKEKTKLLSQFYSQLGYNKKTKVYVIKSNEFNAFALPDNSIFVYDKVLQEVKTYPELAALLAHEYSHIKYRHGMKTLAHSLSRELLTQILTGGDNSQNLIRNSNKLLTLKNSRNFEAEADKGGLQLLIQNHIDINGMSDLFKLMGTISEGKGVPTYLSTHPPIEDRIETIELEIKEEKNDHVYDSKLNNIFEKLINQKEQDEKISNEE